MAWVMSLFAMRMPYTTHKYANRKCKYMHVRPALTGRSKFPNCERVAYSIANTEYILSGTIEMSQELSTTADQQHKHSTVKMTSMN